MLIEQERAMQKQKDKYPEKIFTFDYDLFVNEPKKHLHALLDWLGMEFNEYYLHPDKSTRNILTASVVQARRPISNKSIGGWKNYQNLLKPALRILETYGIPIK